jgi:hypothetical protein
MIPSAADDAEEPHLTLTRLALPPLALVLVACGSMAGPADTGGSPPDGAAAAGPAATSMPTPGTAADPVAPGTAPRSSLAAWQTRELTDVRSGERFAIADLVGKVAVIEPMAIWCTNCARQQREAAKALDRLDSDGIVYISLDVDPSERARDLAAYADERGFDWRFVISERAMSRALAEAFGDQVLSPPSTPKIVVTPNGRVEGPNFGIQDAAAIEAEIRDLIP